MKLKKFKATLGAILLAQVGFSQPVVNTFPSSGNAGIGLSNPNADLQMYGSTDYLVTIGGTGRGSTINYGKTTRLLMTNSSTGSTEADGFLIRFSESDAFLTNQESGNIGISTTGASIQLNGTLKRIGVGGITLTTDATLGYFNILGAGDNGLFVRTTAPGKFGTRIQVADATTNAVEVVNATDVTKKNFSVNGGGVVYARKYTTTLNNIPDYVFSDEYELMDLDSLDTYVTVNNHLPNIPSANEYAETGVDIGEMNRLLLEKVEELTLYILQLKKEIAEIKVSE